jgi:hypothetical protein
MISVSPVKENQHKKVPNTTHVKPNGLMKQDSIIPDETPI